MTAYNALKILINHFFVISEKISTKKQNWRFLNYGNITCWRLLSSLRTEYCLYICIKLNKLYKFSFIFVTTSLHWKIFTKKNNRNLNKICIYLLYIFLNCVKTQLWSQNRQINIYLSVNILKKKKKFTEYLLFRLWLWCKSLNWLNLKVHERSYWTPKTKHCTITSSFSYKTYELAMRHEKAKCRSAAGSNLPQQPNLQ